jgi:hypothetical protein
MSLKELCVHGKGGDLAVKLDPDHGLLVLLLINWVTLLLRLKLISAAIQSRPERSALVRRQLWASNSRRGRHQASSVSRRGIYQTAMGKFYCEY